MPEEFLQQIAALKAQYGEPLYGIALGESFYICRPLIPAEYEALAAAGLLDAEHICQLAVLWPAVADWEQAKAADPEQLADAIRTVSGYGSRDAAVQLLADYRAEMETFQGQAQAVIAAAFPRLSLEEIAAMPLETLLYYLSRAEWILKQIRGLDITITLEGDKPALTPEEREAEAAKLRSEGADPMLMLYRPPRRDANWLTGPVIHGPGRWRDYGCQKDGTASSTPPN